MEQVQPCQHEPSAVAVIQELRRRTGGAFQTGLAEVGLVLAIPNPDSVAETFGKSVFLVLFVLAIL